MTNINIVFDGEFDDVDIIAVPDNITNNIVDISKEFLEWVCVVKGGSYTKTVNGHTYINAETDGFIEWLNSYYCTGFKKAYVVARNTSYHPLYKSIEF